MTRTFTGLRQSPGQLKPIRMGVGKRCFKGMLAAEVRGNLFQLETHEGPVLQLRHTLLLWAGRHTSRCRYGHSTDPDTDSQRESVEQY